MSFKSFRFNGKPMRVRIQRAHGGFEFSWWRWFDRPKQWRKWQSYLSLPGTTFSEALQGYRGYAEYWRTGNYE